jgi:Ca2+-binding RTX toxin-like protein
VTRRGLAIVAVALAALTMTGGRGLAAGNTVTSGRVGRLTGPITVANLRPAACTNGAPVNLVVGTVTVTGTTQNDLVLGSVAVDTMDGRQQDDCILGGAGNDVIDGFNGTDVCIGGPGTDVFVRCETEIQ